MKISRSIIVALILALVSICDAYGQCAAMYKQGQKYMKSGKYELAIKEFKSAMECDPGLTAKCKQSITQCNNALKKSKKAEAKPSVLNLSKYALDFGSESNNATITVDESWPEEWTVNQTDLPDWIKANFEVADTTINILVTPNDSFESREYKVIVTNGDVSKEITVKQQGVPETMTVNYDVLYFNKNKKCVVMSKDGIRRVLTNKNDLRDYGTIDIAGTVNDRYVIDDVNKPDWVNFKRTETSIIVEVNAPLESKSKNKIPDVKGDCRVYSFMLKSPTGKVLIPITICQMTE